MSSDTRYPPWLDAAWPQVKAALRADENNEKWAAAIMKADIACRRAWRDAGYATTSIRACATVWFWYTGGDSETWPTPEQAEAHYEKTLQN